MPLVVTFAMNSWSDIQEEAFVKCLHEIEKSYVHLPKMLRIRTERWVDKLVSTGGNPAWRRNRNAYSRVLLNCVVTKAFTEPFHTLPPDGALPTFPVHVKAFTKDLLGPHETRFWRGLYERVSDVTKENPPYCDNSEQQQASAVSREVRNLSLIIREQSQRIASMEQQIRDEREKYEMEIQRIHFTHRQDVVRLSGSSASALGSLASQAPLDPPSNPLPVPQVSRSPYTGRAYSRSEVLESMDRSSALRPPPAPLSLSLTQSQPMDAARTMPWATSLDFPSFVAPAALEQQRSGYSSRSHSNDSLSPPPPAAAGSSQFSAQMLSLSPQPMADLLPKKRPMPVFPEQPEDKVVTEDDFLTYIDQFQNQLKLSLDDSTAV